jgi:hypothetical protein
MSEENWHEYSERKIMKMNTIEYLKVICKMVFKHSISLFSSKFKYIIEYVRNIHCVMLCFGYQSILQVIQCHSIHLETLKNSTYSVPISEVCVDTIVILLMMGIKKNTGMSCPPMTYCLNWVSRKPGYEVQNSNSECTRQISSALNKDFSTLVTIKNSVKLTTMSQCTTCQESASRYCSDYLVTTWVETLY